VSNTLAISAVTEAFSALLRNVSDEASLDPTLVTQDPPDRARTPQRNGHQLNLFLYQVTPNPGLANADLPFRSSSGQILAQPQLALDLHYLLTAYGVGDNETDAQHVLAYAMSVVHDAGSISRETIRNVVIAANSPVAASDLVDQVEPVRLTPQVLSEEDLFRLWSMFQTKYRLSVGYTASVVLVERRRQFRKAPPVTRSGATAITLRKPRIDEVSPQPAQPGDTLTLIGGNLRADTVTVRINGVDRPTAKIEDEQITLALPADVNAGPNVAQVVQGHVLNEIDVARDVLASDPVPFVVAPTITSPLPATVARGATLTLTIAPQVRRAQHVVALIDAAALERVQDPKGPPGPTGSVSFAIPATMPTGPHLLRVEVDGVESRLVQDQTPGPNFGKFTGPLVNVT
jgi:Pvc16 N-terminal domain/IPT/TIG domain